MNELKSDRPLVFHFYNKQHTKGGATVVYDPQTSLLASCVCCEKDSFRRRAGVSICMTRIKSADRIRSSKVNRRIPYLQEYSGARNLPAIRQAAEDFALECADHVHNRSIVEAIEQQRADLAARQDKN